MRHQTDLFDFLPMPAERQVKRFQPRIPETGWTAPKEFPNLQGVSVLALDTETYDPELKTHGPGWGRHRGELVGFSLATTDHKAWYFPLRHRVKPEENLPVEPTLRYLIDVLGSVRQLVGANLIYDLGWLKESGITVSRTVQLHDVQYAQALLDQRSPVNVDYLAEHYLKDEKKTNILYNWIRLAYKLSKKDDPRSEIYRSPPSLVGPYGEQDALLPIRLMPILGKKLKQENLLDVFKLECGLITLLVEMRYQGVPVSLDRAEEVREKLLTEIAQREQKLEQEYKTAINIDAPSCLKILLKDHINDLPKTAKTEQPSFSEPALLSIDTPVVNEILELRKMKKIISTFIEGAILKYAVNGRIHCQFHPLRGEKNGTGYGRFASSDPNLQQIPSRHPVWGPLLRSLFVPDDEIWLCDDYASIEARLFAHYSNDERLIKQYQEPDADFHTIVSNILGGNLPRKVVKQFSFSVLYGGGVNKVAQLLHASMAEEEIKKLIKGNHKDIYKTFAQQVSDLYAREFPAAQETMRRYMQEAQQKKEVRTLLNRRALFELYQATSDYKSQPLPYKQALRLYGSDLSVAYTYKALNHVLQGGSADIMKQALYNCWHKGIFDDTGLPYLTVHDELDMNKLESPQARIARVAMIKEMETCIPLKIPVTVESSSGKNWGECK